MRKLITIALLGLMMVGITVSATPDDDFTKANEHYEAGEYDKAVGLYLGIVEQGQESAPLYFNLGNAYFKNGDLGRAILYYLKARRLDPGDEDILSNLEFAQQFTGIQMEGVQLNPINSFIESLVAPYRLVTLAWVCSTLFVLWMILLILRFGVGFRAGSIRVGIIVGIILLVVAVSITSYKYRHDYLARRAVLVCDDCPVRTGPSETQDVELEAVPGLVVEILTESDDYYNVLFENKRRGWIKKDLVAEI